MKRMIEHVEANMADADYNAQRLSEDICMSRIKRFKKFGVTPSEYAKQKLSEA